VLEIFLYGGLSPWETFYVVPTLADPWRSFRGAIDDITWPAGCNGPSTNTLTQSFGCRPHRDGFLRGFFSGFAAMSTTLARI
jgi:hypothetical protein